MWGRRINRDHIASWLSSLPQMELHFTDFTLIWSRDFHRTIGQFVILNASDTESIPIPPT